MHLGSPHTRELPSEVLLSLVCLAEQSFEVIFRLEPFSCWTPDLARTLTQAACVRETLLFEKGLNQPDATSGGRRDVGESFVYPEDWTQCQTRWRSVRICLMLLLTRSGLICISLLFLGGGVSDKKPVKKTCG